MIVGVGVAMSAEGIDSCCGEVDVLKMLYSPSNTDEPTDCKEDPPVSRGEGGVKDVFPLTHLGT